MDKLDADKQAVLKKIPTERLISKLVAVGRKEEEVEDMKRSQVLNLFAELYSKGKIEIGSRSASPVEGTLQDATKFEQWRISTELARQQKKDEDERQFRLAELARLQKKDEEELARQQKKDEEELARQQKKIEEELARQRRKDEEEKQIRLEELARQRKKDEEEKQIRLEELARQQKKDEEELARQRRKDEEEKQIRLEELARQRRKDEEELRLKEQELRIKELELARWHQKDTEDKQFREKEIAFQEENILLTRRRREIEVAEKDSLVFKVKQYSDAMRNILWKFPDVATEIPNFFDHLENCFMLYEVEETIKVKLLQMCLNDKAKLLTSRLTYQQLDNYETVKQFLLDEFRISPIKLREQIYSLKRQSNETYQLFVSKLRNALMYYLKSRNIKNDFDKLVHLLIADRVKELMPRGCLNFILSQEQDGWLDCDQLAKSADNFTASHEGEDFVRKEPKPRTETTFSKPEPGPNRQASDIAKEEARKKGLCFICQARGHLAKNCPNRTPVKVSTCSIESRTRPGVMEQPNVADPFFKRTFIPVNIEGIDQQSALVDGGSEICCINSKLVEPIDVPVQKKISILGLKGESTVVDVVFLRIKPGGETNDRLVNICPMMKVWFAVVPDLNEKVILTPSVVELLHSMETYNITSDESIELGNKNLPEPKTCKTEEVIVEAIEVENNDQMMVEPVVEESLIDKIHRTADVKELKTEQENCPSLKKYWELAVRNKKNFYVEDGLLHHKETLWGHKIVQLCLPETRIPVVLEMGHDAPFAGHMAFRSTKHRIKLNFWFPEMDRRIKEYCMTCTVCQLRAPSKVSQRVPITPISRDDDLPFSHLIMDCIGPLFPERDPIKSKPEYKYALVVVDKFSRWPMAYPLRTLKAKAVCDALLQIFMTFSIPRIISSDCGANFTSQLTQEFLKSLGCSPRFNTPGHPEAAGLVERCNQSLKTIIYKLVQENPKGWHQLLPFVLWSLRERPSSTTHISPYTLIYGTIPRGPLTVLKESWVGERILPFNLGKKPEEYLRTLKENLDLAKAYSDFHSTIEQKRYAHNYNLRSTDRRYQVGDKVVILAPNLIGAKCYNRWQGPGVISRIKSPYSYIVELDGKRQHVHANKIMGYHERIEQAVVNSCSLIFDSDEDFGQVTTIGEKVSEEDKGEELPIAFASMKLTEPQARWSTIEREAYAVTWNLKKFRSWICLSRVIVFSDHNPLTYLTEAAPRSAKLTRWALALQEFNLDFRYHPGRRNMMAS